MTCSSSSAAANSGCDSKASAHAVSEAGRIGTGRGRNEQSAARTANSTACSMGTSDATGAGPRASGSHTQLGFGKGRCHSKRSSTNDQDPVVSHYEKTCLDAVAVLKSKNPRVHRNYKYIKGEIRRLLNGCADPLVTDILEQLTEKLNNA
jgi:hypothetical protein